MRFVIRVIGFLCVAGGFVALVIDGTRAIANSHWSPMSLGALIANGFPKIFPQIEPWVSRNLHPLVWDPVLVTFFAAPAFVAFMAIGFGLMFLARRPREDIGFLAR